MVQWADRKCIGLVQNAKRSSLENYNYLYILLLFMNSTIVRLKTTMIS